MFSRLDFILDLRLKGKSRIVGFVILGAFFVSLLVFLLAGNGRVERSCTSPASTAAVSSRSAVSSRGTGRWRAASPSSWTACFSALPGTMQ